jgi:hypothetical protein
MNDMVERVARAQWEWERANLHAGEGAAWEELDERDRTNRLASARAGIEALREPNEQMTEVGAKWLSAGDWRNPQVGDAWRGMIEVAAGNFDTTCGTPSGGPPRPTPGKTA